MFGHLFLAENDWSDLSSLVLFNIKPAVSFKLHIRTCTSLLLVVAGVGKELQLVVKLDAEVG